MNLVRDIRFAIRQLLQNRTVTVVAAIALALGIGANTAIFSVIHAVLLKPLPYRDPDRLVTLLQMPYSPISGGDVHDIGVQAASFERVGAAESWGGNLSGGERPERLTGMRLSEGMFQLLGVPAFRGRVFLSEDFEPGHENVLVLSYGLWQRRFGASSSAIGKSVTVNGAPFTIVGVMPPEFRFAPFWITQTEMWTPLQLNARLHEHQTHSLRGFARLRPGVTLAAAQAEVNGICGNISRAWPSDEPDLRILVESLNETAVGNVRPALLAMIVAVGLVLLIACANVANLVLAKAAGRRREIAIRLSLGAGRARIVKQLLTESVVLSLAGAVPALLLAVWGTSALQSMLAPEEGSFRGHLFGSNRIAVDTPVLLFALALALVTGILVGLAPALLESTTDLNSRLKEGARSISGGQGSGMRKVLLISEVALAIVLLSGAGLLTRSFLKLRAIDPGFDPRNVLTMEVSVTGLPQYVGPARESLYRQLVRGIESVPGVRSVALINHVPLAGDVWGLPLSVEGRPVRPGPDRNAVYRVAGPHYFATMRLPILAGREFDDRDIAAAPLVAVVNEKLAKKHWPHESALGKRISLDDIRHNPRWWTIVGVVKDAKQGDWTRSPGDEVYVSLWQTPELLNAVNGASSYISLVVRTGTGAAALSNAVRNTIWSIDRNLPVSRVQTLEHAIGNSTWQPRFNLLLSGIFAAVALLLAVVGIYGVMAYEVARRTQEIGIRMALGAGRAGLLGMVLSQSLRVVLAGTVAGIASALALARLMSSLLYGVRPIDAVTFTAVPVLVLFVAALASWIPARRAAAVDPVVALRWE